VKGIGGEWAEEKRSEEKRSEIGHVDGESALPTSLEGSNTIEVKP